MKRNFFLAAVVSVLLVWMHHMDADLSFGEKVWRQSHKNAASWTEQVLVATSHKVAALRTPISKTIHIRRTRHARYSRKSKGWLISGVLLWTPSQGRARVRWPASTYVQQLCTDRGCRLEDLPRAMDDRDEWRESIREISVSNTSWWWTESSVTYFGLTDNRRIRTIVYHKFSDHNSYFEFIVFQRLGGFHCRG